MLDEWRHVALIGPDELLPTLAFDYPLVAAIADFVLTLLPPAPTTAMQPQPQPPTQLSAAAANASGQQSEGVSCVFCPKACSATAAPYLPAVQN